MPIDASSALSAEFAATIRKERRLRDHERNGPSRDSSSTHRKLDKLRAHQREILKEVAAEGAPTADLEQLRRRSNALFERRDSYQRSTERLGRRAHFLDANSRDGLIDRSNYDELRVTANHVAETKARLDERGRSLHRDLVSGGRTVAVEASETPPPPPMTPAEEARLAPQLRRRERKLADKLDTLLRRQSSKLEVNRKGGAILLEPRIANLDAKLADVRRQIAEAEGRTATPKEPISPIRSWEALFGSVLGARS